MKHAKKVWHTSIISHEDPVLELNKHLKMYRATPHPTTGKSPAELLFTRKYRIKLPDIRTNPAVERSDIQQDRKVKAKQKMYKDAKATVRPHNIKEGDTILLQRKSTKSDSPYDPQPFIAEEVHGTQIIGRRGEETKVRDSQKWKRVELRAAQQFSRKREKEDDPDIGLPATYKGTLDEHRGDQGQAGEHHQAQLQGQEGPQGQVQRGGSRERWSFSPPAIWPPASWTERPRRPLTRSITTRRQENRERVQHRAEDRTRQGWI